MIKTSVPDQTIRVLLFPREAEEVTPLPSGELDHTCRPGDFKLPQRSTGRPSGSFGGLTHEQIMKVVRTRARAIQACYSRELQRNKGLGGKVIVNWKIDTAGKVSRTRVRSTTMKNGRVEDCVVRQVNSMKFPTPKGGGSATVNFPFIFGQQ